MGITNIDFAITVGTIVKEMRFSDEYQSIFWSIIIEKCDDMFMSYFQMYWDGMITKDEFRKYIIMFVTQHEAEA